MMLAMFAEIALAANLAFSCELLNLKHEPRGAAPGAREKVVEGLRNQAKDVNYNFDNPKLESYRFIHESDWTRHQGAEADNIWNLYGERAWTHWKDGAEKILKTYKTMEFSVGELHEIHRLAMKESYFKGFEQRRIRAAADKGTISQFEAQNMLAKISAGERVFYSGRDHGTLLGAFRSETVDDNLTQDRPLRDRDGAISKADFENLKKNNYIRVTKFEMAPKDEGINAYIEFPKSSEVHKLVEAELNILRDVLLSSEDVYAKFSKVVKVYTNLVSIHPYLNGNGRVLRLFFDGVFMRMGLPPALHNFDREFTASPREIESYTLLGMSEYLRLRFETVQ